MKAWKTLKNLLLVSVVMLVAFTLNSCLDDDDSFSLDKFSAGIVTVKPLGNRSFYLQLGDSTTLWPAAGITPHFGVDKERRALASFTLLGYGKDMGIDYTYAIRLNQIDSVLTKSIAEDLGDRNDEYYGNNPVTMKAIWIEDGYITFQFASYSGAGSRHFINLIKRKDTGDYELEFRHKNEGNTTGGEVWGLTCFRLNSLPETNGKEVIMKIKYKSYEGDKTYELKYTSGEPSGRAPVMNAENFQEMN